MILGIFVGDIHQILPPKTRYIISIRATTPKFGPVQKITDPRLHELLVPSAQGIPQMKNTWYKYPIISISIPCVIENSWIAIHDDVTQAFELKGLHFITSRKDACTYFSILWRYRQPLHTSTHTIPSHSWASYSSVNINRLIWLDVV